MKTALAVLAAIALAVPSAACASHPTFRDTHVVAHLAFDDYAATLDGEVVVGPCAHRGRSSTVCRLRIAGAVIQRYRIVVTAEGEDFSVRARPLR